jgi:hypothetical protein
MIGFGPPEQVLQTEKLIQAYGGRLKTHNEGTMVIDDCCGDEDEHGHVH